MGLTAAEAKTLWEKNYRSLRAFKEEHDNCDVPTKSGPLGAWVKKQREQHRRGKLSSDRETRLKEIGFTWNVRNAANEEAWEKHFRSLRAFRAEHGNCDVPTKSGPLGMWVENQRQQHRKGKLSTERAARLEEIEFAWNVQDAANEEAWEENFGDLAAYKKSQGHCNVRRRDGQLGAWVAKQRARKGNLSKDRIKRLKELGFKWALGRRGGVTSRVSDDEGAGARGRGGVAEMGVARGRGAMGRNRPRRDGESEDDKDDKGEALGRGQVVSEGEGTSSGGSDEDSTGRADEARWEEKYQLFVAFLKEQGHCRVPRKKGLLASLGTWVENQRRQHREGTLSSDRATQLEAIGFKWNPNDARWEENFRKLQRYQEVQGHCNVPRNQGQLGGWVQTQRRNYKNGKLSDDRIKRLGKLGFKWAQGRERRAAMPRVSDDEDAEAQGEGGGAERGVARGRRRRQRNRHDRHEEDGDDDKRAVLGRGQVVPEDEGTSSDGPDADSAEGKRPHKKRRGERRKRRGPSAGRGPEKRQRTFSPAASSAKVRRTHTHRAAGIGNGAAATSASKPASRSERTKRRRNARRERKKCPKGRKNDAREAKSEYDELRELAIKEDTAQRQVIDEKGQELAALRKELDQITRKSQEREKQLKILNKIKWSMSLRNLPTRNLAHHKKEANLRIDELKNKNVKLSEQLTFLKNKVTCLKEKQTDLAFYDVDSLRIEVEQF